MTTSALSVRRAKKGTVSFSHSGTPASNIYSITQLKLATKRPFCTTSSASSASSPLEDTSHEFYGATIIPPFARTKRTCSTRNTNVDTKALHHISNGKTLSSATSKQSYLMYPQQFTARISFAQIHGPMPSPTGTECTTPPTCGY